MTPSSFALSGGDMSGVLVALAVPLARPQQLSRPKSIVFPRPTDGVRAPLSIRTSATTNDGVASWRV